MKNYWTNKIFGLVEVEMYKRETGGESPTRLVNVISRKGIELFNVKYINEMKMKFSVSLRDIPTLRKVIRGTGVKIRFKKRLGLNFKIFRYSKRRGLVGGTLLALFTIFLLSNVVWRIEISGASSNVESEIRDELSNMGIRQFRFNFNASSPDEIQKALTNNISDVTWIGVDSVGSIYKFQVVEKLSQEKSDVVKHPQLVASKKGIIVRNFLDSGQSVVEPNQVVQKGQQLASGYIGKEDNLAYVGASGEVWALTWYTVTSEVPLKTESLKQTGEKHTRISLRFGDRAIPVLGFKDHGYKNATTEEQNYNFRFLKWELPISIHKTVSKEVETSERILPKEVAFDIALENARNDLSVNVSAGAEVKEENVLHKVSNDDKVVVNVHYEVLENIAVGAKMPEPTVPISN